MARSPLKRSGSRGFTLVEVLVALVVFSFLMVSAFQLFDSILTVNQRSQEQSQQQQQISHAWLVIFQDLIHLRNRPHRDIQGDKLPAYETTQYELMQFVRGGLPPITGIAPGGLQLVAYRLENHQLKRISWSVIDLANDSAESSEVLLDDVDTVLVEHLTNTKEWSEVWPPVNTGRQQRNKLLPRMIRITIRFMDGRDMQRLLPGVGE